jgi:hypothetical protein
MGKGMENGLNGMIMDRRVLKELSAKVEALENAK